MNCPYCKSNKIVKNGFTKSKKQRYLCRKCSKSFSETSYRKYPPTSYPFEFIAYFLYCRIETNPRYSRSRRVDGLLQFLDIEFKSVPRQTIYSWIKKYGPIYKDIISFNTARKFFANHIDKNKLRPEFDGMPEMKLKKIEELYGPYEVLDSKRKTYVRYVFGEPPKHTEMLKSLSEILGEDMVRYLTRKFPEDEDLHRIYIKLKCP